MYWISKCKRRKKKKKERKKRKENKEARKREGQRPQELGKTMLRKGQRKTPTQIKQRKSNRQNKNKNKNKSKSKSKSKTKQMTTAQATATKRRQGSPASLRSECNYLTTNKSDVGGPSPLLVKSEQHRNTHRDATR